MSSLGTLKVIRAFSFLSPGVMMFVGGLAHVFSAQKRLFLGKGSYSKDRASMSSSTSTSGRGDRRSWDFKHP